MPLFKAISSVKDKLTLTPNELMIKEVTSNDDSLISTTTLHSVAELTFQPMDYTRVMEAVWSSIRAPRQEWRRVQRAVLLADVLMKFGSSRCVQELRDFVDRFKPLVEFRYTDDDMERGAIIREKSRYLVEVLSDFAKIEVERDTAKKQKKKCVGMSRDDVYRGNYRKNVNYDDVKGYYSYEMNKGEGKGGMASEDSKEERVEEPKEEKKVMAASISQPVLVERTREFPSFEPATLVPDQRNYREGPSSGGQPVMPSGYNKPTQNYPPPQPSQNFPPAQPTSQYIQPPAPVYISIGMPAPTSTYPQAPQAPMTFTPPSGPVGAGVNPANTQGPNPYQGYYNQGVPGGYMQQPNPSQMYPAQVNPQYNPYNVNVNMPQMNPYPQAGYPSNVGYSGHPGNPSPMYSAPVSQMNPGNNPNTQAKSNIKHNLPSMQAQVEPAKPPPKSVDLESLLMNLDGLQPNNKHK